MSMFLWHVIADMSGSWFGLLDEEKDDRWSPRYGYVYYCRTARTIVDNGNFIGLWPRTRGLDPNGDGLYMFGNQDAADGGLWEPLMVIDGGNYRPYYVKGRCVDGSGNPVATCSLDMYIAGTKTFVVSGFSDQNGYYSLPTAYPIGTQYEIYANYANSTLVGASANTLVGTL